MATVVVDIIEGAAASHDVLKGWEITRTAIVTGLDPVTLSATRTSASATVTMASTVGVAIGQIVSGTGIAAGTSVVSFVPNTSALLSIAATASGTTDLVFGPTDTASLIQGALNAVIAVVGDRGAACPNIAVQTFLQTFIPEIIAANVVKVSIKYKGYPLPVYEFDGSMNQVQTNLDSTGKKFTVQYTYPATQNFQFDPRLAGTTVTQGGLLNLPVPEPIFIIKWLVVGTNPSLQIDIFKATYEGKINNGAVTFFVGGTSYPKHSVLIEKVSARTPDGGITYEAQCMFHVKPTPPGGTSGGWDPQATFINSGDGMPPPDLVSGTGYKQVQVLPEVTFPTFTFGPN